MRKKLLGLFSIIFVAVLLVACAKTTFKVNFDLNGGTSEAIAAQEVKEGELAVKPTDPTREYASFLGWFEGDEKYDFSVKVEKDLTLLARWEIDYDEVVADLKEHYKDTLGNADWVPEDIVLVEEFAGFPVTWESNNTDYFTNDGKVTTPSFQEGDKTIMLKASLTPIASETFFFIIKKADQTTAELLDEILRLVTIVPSSPSGYQEQNFEVTNSYDIEGESVDITWTTSDDTAMLANGNLVPFEDVAEKEVVLTASITYDGVTRTRDITFLIKGVETYASFADALVDANEGEKVRVEGVSYFMPINTNKKGGYYVASEDNLIAFVYGDVPADLKEGKLYDVMFEVDIYFGSYQLKSPAFINERDGDLPEITAVDMTLEDIVNLPKPSAQSFHHTYLKLTDVEVRIDRDKESDDRYNVFLVPEGLPEGESLTDMNSLMVYYVSNIEVIRDLNGRVIKEIYLINNGYRTNNIVWYVNYIGDGSDIVLGELPDDELVIAVKDALKEIVPFRALDEEDLPLAEERDGAAIEWTSSHPEIIAADGTVTLPEEGTEVTLTAAITKGEDDAEFVRKVWVQKLEDLEADDIADIVAYDGNFSLMPFKVKGIVTGAVGDRSFTLQDDTGGIAIRTLFGVALDFGYEYTVVGAKGVFAGLVQLNQVGDAIKGDEGVMPEATVLTEADLGNNAYLEPLQATLVSFDGAEIIEKDVDGYENTELTLKLGAITISMRWDSRVDLPEEAVALLRTLVVGDVVNVVGAPLGWYNGPQLGYNDASQLVVVIPDTDEGIVAAALAALNIPQIVTEDLDLPAEGRFDASVAWESSVLDVIAVDGTLTMPEENIEVLLTATVSHGEYSQVAKFLVLVQAEEGVVNVKLARAVAIDEIVKFKGIVSGMEPDRYVYVSDLDGTTIVLFQPVRPEGLALGDMVVVEGERATFNNMQQIAKDATIEIQKSGLDVPLPVEVDKIPAFKEDDQGKRFSIENLLVVSVSGRFLTVTDGIKEVTVYVDPDNTDLVNYLADAAGKKVDLVGIHLGWYHSSGQFLIHEESEVVIKDLTDLDKAYYDLKNLDFPEKVTTEDKLELPAKGGKYEQDIVWTSDNEEVIAIDGTVTLPEEAVTVTLTATITVGEEEVVESYVIIVDPKAPEVFTATLKYSGSSGNLGVDNEAATLNLDPEIFDVRAIQGDSAGFNIGVNAAGQVRIYSVRASGDGNKLKLSIAEGMKITGIKFVFEKAGNPSNSGLLTLGAEEVNLSEADLQTTMVYEDLDITEFSLLNDHMGGDKNGQIWIVEIVITYVNEG